jgi:hypothetical protein
LNFDVSKQSFGESDPKEINKNGKIRERKSVDFCIQIRKSSAIKTIDFLENPLFPKFMKTGS